MALSEGDRLRFKQWLVDNQLEEHIASAILDGMAPHDWHEQATKADIAKLEQRFDQVDKRFAQVDKRFAQVDKEFAQVDHRFDLIEQRFEQRFEGVDGRFKGIDQRLQTLEEQMRSNQASVHSRFDSLAKDIRVITLTMIGFLVTLVMTLVGGGITLLVT